jgi:dipeptidase D
MDEIKNLEPNAVWKYFDLITSIPRPSKHEERIIRYLVEFGLSLGLHVKRDYIGNLVIVKRASKGFENRKKIVLQSHVDMVCEKNSDVVHDFLNDKIKYYRDGEWMKARGTTLGADDGIGIAAMLAVLSDKSIQHGPLECLFTVDEETGLTGAFEMRPRFISGTVLLNLDSEDEGEIFIGCAGGVDTTAFFNITTVSPDDLSISPYEIRISGLQGGHSGDDIEKNRGNSIKILTEIMNEAVKDYRIKISKLEVGNLRNAIPREAYAKIVVPAESEGEFKKWFESKQKELSKTYRENESLLKTELIPSEFPANLLSEDLQTRLLISLTECPHGIIAWSKDMENLVETSTNLASVKFTEDNRITICTSQRSSIDTQKKAIASKVASVFLNCKADIKQGNGYPGWKPNPDSEILKIAADAYAGIFNQNPKIKAIHAGLECGLFLEKYPNLDMISFGPTIKGAHSPDERLNIPSVEKFWYFLLEILKNVPEKNN